MSQGDLRSATHTTWASTWYVDTVRRKVPTNPRLSKGTRSGRNAKNCKQTVEVQTEAVHTHTHVHFCSWGTAVMYDAS